MTDDMTWTDIATAVPALIPLLTLVITLARGPGALRSRLKHDVELVEKVPESPARESLLMLIDREVKALAQFHEAKRDLPMFVLSLIAAPTLGYLTIWLISRDELWAWPFAAASGLLAIVFIYGIFETGERVPRDERGKRIGIPTVD